MTNLILHPTDISQWHALVNEAEASTRLVLNESTESYLVFLLMRFTQEAHLLESIIALDLLESLHATRAKKVDGLREVGDKSLLLCGLFPGIAKKRHVKLEYYSEVGQAAYLLLSELEEKLSAELYLQLSKQFTKMQHILQAMRNHDDQACNPSGRIINDDLSIQ